jgi:hypothetical protein
MKLDFNKSADRAWGYPDMTQIGSAVCLADVPKNIAIMPCNHVSQRVIAGPGR